MDLNYNSLAHNKIDLSLRHVSSATKCGEWSTVTNAVVPFDEGAEGAFLAFYTVQKSLWLLATRNKFYVII